MILTSQDIRNVLKTYDGWFKKVSQADVILDTKYEEVSNDDAEKFGNMALDEIVSIFKKHDPIKYKDLSRDTLYTTYKEQIRDCENFSGLYVEIFKLFWSLDESKKYEPALFRTIIEGDQGPHAVAGFYYFNGIKLFDPQIDQWVLTRKILAVA